MFQLSTYNVIIVIICLVFKLYLHEYLIDVARAIALLVFIASFYFQLVYDVRSLSDIFSVRLDDPTFVEWTIITTVNAVWHAAPLFLIGLPKRPSSMLFAWAIVLIWYVCIRNKVQDVYTHMVTVQEYDVIMFGIVPTFSALVYGAAKFVRM